MRSGIRLQAPHSRLRLDRLPLPLLLSAALLTACASTGRTDPEAPARDAQPVAVPPPPVAPPAPPQPAVVPKGCDINLAGRYKLAKKPFWTYVVEDDGEHLLARRADLPDAGPESGAPGQGPSGPALVLDRTPGGFLGHELGYARSASGERCPVTFRAEVVACTPQGLTVRSEDAVALDDQCRIQRRSDTTSEKVLVRQ